MDELTPAANDAFMIDAQKITIRPAKPSDAVLEADFLAGLSDTAEHFIFLGNVGKMSNKQLIGLRDNDYPQSMAYVAVTSENGKQREVGLAWYDLNPNTGSHEAVVAIADEFRNTELSLKLLQELANRARKHDVKVLFLKSMSDNAYMGKLAKDLGMSIRLDPNNARRVIYSLSVDEYPERITI